MSDSFFTTATEIARQIATNQNKYLSKYTGAKAIEAKDINIQFDQKTQRAYVDFDGDGITDYSLSKEDVNVSNPIVRDLREQKRVLLLDTDSSAQARRLIAQIDEQIKALGGNPDISNMEAETLPPETQVKAADVKQEQKPEQKKEIEETPENNAEKYIGTPFNISNPKNPNGTINGTISNVQFNEKNELTSVTVKSKESGNEFTYTFDEKTGRFINKKENKYYKLDENNNLVRDNEYEATKIRQQKAEIQETVVTAQAPGEEKLKKMKELGVTSAGVKDYFVKTDETSNKKSYYHYNQETGEFDKVGNIESITVSPENGKNYVIRTKNDKGGYTETYYTKEDNKMYQSVEKDNENRTLTITKKDGLKTTIEDANGKLLNEKIVDKNGNVLYQKDYTIEEKQSVQSLSFKSKKAVNNGNGFKSETINYQTFKNEFNNQIFSCSYLNSIVNNYGIEAAKELIEAYDTEAKENGTKTIGQQLNTFMLGLNGELKAFLQGK